MKSIVTRCALLALCWLLPATTWGASIFHSPINAWQFQTSVYTKHFDPDPEHNNHTNLIDVEAWTENRWLYGFGVFDNSFGQPSQYLYVGRHWPLVKSEYVYFKVTAGLLHGYKGRYKNKIPLNDLGVAPAILPALGIRYRRVVAEVQLLGSAGLTVTAGLRL